MLAKAALRCCSVLAAIICATTSVNARSSQDQAIRAVCISVEMSSLPKRAELRSAFLSGFRRPFRLDTLLVERRVGYREWVDAGQIVNWARLSTEPCPQRDPDPKGRIWIPVFAESTDTTGLLELGVAVRLGWESTIIPDYAFPKGSHPARDSLPPNRMLLEIWTAVCAPDSARTPLDSMWESSVVNWAERPANAHRDEEIHGWMAGMAALQAVNRHLGLLPDSLDLVFESRGRNR